MFYAHDFQYFYFLQRSMNMKSNESHRLNVYRIRQNQLNLYKQSNQDGYDQYTYQECKKLREQSQKSREQSQKWREQSQEFIQEHKKQQQIIQEDDNNKENDDPNDFADIWETIVQHSEKQLRVEENNCDEITCQVSEPEQQERKKQGEQIQGNKSICELDEEQLAQWMKECETEVNEEKKGVENREDVQQQIKSNCSQVSGLEQIWEMIQEQDERNVQDRQDRGSVSKVEQIICCQTKVDEQRKQQESVSIPKQQSQLNQPVTIFQTHSQHKLQINVPQPIYLSFPNSTQLYLPDLISSQTDKNAPIIIQQQIYQELYDDDQEEFRKYNSLIMVYGLDYLIYDLSKFCRSNLKSSTHTHLGLKCFGYFPSSEKNLSEDSINNTHTPKRDYLFQPITGQCLIETVYLGMETVSKYKINKIAQRINFFLCPNKQKIAIAEKVVFEQSKQKRQIFQLKAYDEFSGKCCEYLGIVETKIAKMGDQWFCDTIIYVPLKKIYNRKINSHDWQKLKISLKLKNGMIMAELGVQSAENSVTNCILYNQENSCQFMMGLLQKKAQYQDFILRIGGISPVLSMLAAISRKQFANSSQ